MIKEIGGHGIGEHGERPVQSGLITRTSNVLVKTDEICPAASLEWEPALRKAAMSGWG